MRLAAVRPFIVAGDEDKWMADPRELRLPGRDPRVAAGLGPRRAAYVADVHDERELLRVDPVDHGVQALDLGLVVGCVAQNPEDERGVRRKRRLAGARRQAQHEKQGPKSQMP